ncbi:MAG: DUF115 domain-containing protein [Clostridium sp.]|nr:DUF115 domain-containing protein [Clostridium sp.]
MKNEIYEHNIEALEKRYEELAEAIAAVQTDSGQFHACDVHAELYDTGERNVLIAAKEDGPAYQLDSMYRPDLASWVWGEQMQIDQQVYMPKYIFFGIGNGSLLRILLKYSDDTLRVVVYEPYLLFFRELISLCDYADLILDERVEWIIEDMPVVFKDFVYGFADFRDLNKLYYQPYPNYRSLFSKEQQDARWTVQMFHNSVQATQDVLAKFGKQYFINTMRNMADLVRTKSLVQFYEKMPKEIPFIMVASGPSLDKNIDELKGLKGKAFIMAADSALRVLLKHGIIPDMFVSVDAQKNQRHFEYPGVEDIPIFTDATNNYQTLLKIHAPKFFMNDMNPHVNHFLAERGILIPTFGTGGSVANDGYALASAMGFKTIILVGQDLAYTDNKTHSQESVRGEWKMDANEFIHDETDGYYGGKVKTSHEFQLYQKWFEEEIPKFPESHTINATEGGALIKGAENMPLAEAVARYCTKEYDIAAVLDSIEDVFDDATKRDLIAYLQKAPEELAEIRRKAKNAVRDYDKIIEIAYSGNLKQGELKRLLSHTAEVSRLMERAPVMFYIQNEMQETTHDQLQQVYEAKESAREELIHTAKIGKEYLEVAIRTIDECMPEIELYMGKLSEILP